MVLLAQARLKGVVGRVWLWQAAAAGEASRMVRKQQGKKFWCGHVVNEAMLIMSKGKLLLVAPADLVWWHIPLQYRWH